MYEIKENRRELFDGTEITTYTRDVVVPISCRSKPEQPVTKVATPATADAPISAFPMKPAQISMSHLSWTDSAATVLKLLSAATANLKL